MIAIEVDCDEDTEANIAMMFEHILDEMIYNYSVSLQGR